MVTPNEYFDEIYCMNLNRSWDRWETIKEKFIREEIYVTRFEGIDKNNLQIRQDFESHLRRLGKQSLMNKLGRYAVWRAFTRLFEHILKTKNNSVLIFEDDILFHKDFKELFSKSIYEIPPQWNMWYLGCTQLKQTGIDYSKMFYKATHFTYGCFAIALKRDFIASWINKYKLALKNNDHFFATSVNHDNIYVSHPKLIGHQYGYSINADYIIDETKAEKLQYFKYNQNIYL